MVQIPAVLVVMDLLVRLILAAGAVVRQGIMAPVVLVLMDLLVEGRVARVRAEVRAAVAQTVLVLERMLHLRAAVAVVLAFLVRQMMGALAVEIL